MLPHELAASVGGAAMPLMVLWFVFAYLARGRDLARHARALEVRLSELAYPAERAEIKLRTIGESLHEQAKALAAASDTATSRLSQARQGLSTQASELTTVSDQAAMRAMQVMAGLRRHADGLERVTSLLSSRVQIVEAAVREQADALAGASDRALSQSREINATLRLSRSRRSPSTNEKTAANAGAIREALREQSQDLAEQPPSARGRARGRNPFDPRRPELGPHRRDRGCARSGRAKWASCCASSPMPSPTPPRRPRDAPAPPRSRWARPAVRPKPRPTISPKPPTSCLASRASLPARATRPRTRCARRCRSSPKPRAMQLRVDTAGAAIRERTDDVTTAAVRMNDVATNLGAETRNLQATLERLAARTEASSESVRRQGHELATAADQAGRARARRGRSLPHPVARACGCRSTGAGARGCHHGRICRLRAK